jgi:hypothetical protein
MRMGAGPILVHLLSAHTVLARRGGRGCRAVAVSWHGVDGRAMGAIEGKAAEIRG